MDKILNNLAQWASEHPFWWQIIAFICILILAFLIFFITKRYILQWIGRIVKKSKTDLDDILFDPTLLRRIAFIPPLLVIYNFAYIWPEFEETFHRISIGMIALFVLLVVGSLLTSLNKYYEKSPWAKNRPIKSYVQIIKLIIYIFGTIIIVAVLIGQSPWYLLTGLGAMTAVLILVFRDTILSFVASLQITSNDLVRVGDWIEVPTFGADGDVIDIALHTVKIQNWDKTFTIIPTHKLIEVSFKNWRGMQVTGGRRIKRSVFIDQTSIKFCDQKMIDNFAKFGLISSYIEDKITEISEYNKKHGDESTSLINRRQITNIGTFRIYVDKYLKRHEKIHPRLTTMVRQLAPGPNGLPLEIYAFTNDTAWINYEQIQSDIFDHILAVVPEFELRIFQNPSGHDFKKAGMNF